MCRRRVIVCKVGRMMNSGIKGLRCTETIIGVEEKRLLERGLGGGKGKRRTQLSLAGSAGRRA